MRCAAFIAALAVATAIATAAGAAPATAPATAAPATLLARDGLLVLTANGRTRDSRSLIGAEMVVPASGKLIGVRLDSLTDAEDRPGLLLHSFTIAATAADGKQIRAPLCAPDRYGRNAAVPVSGTLDAHARHLPDPKRFFLACTSGAVGKCLLWGYAPWGRAPDGRPLGAAYEACLNMVRADYGGDDTHHTKDGTQIDTADIYGVNRFDTDGPQPAPKPGVARPANFVFEAGWGPDGAVCVAHVRWPDIISLATLLAKYPRLAGPCDRASAQAGGALLFTRVVER